jgi:guanylate kinase
MLIAIAGPSTIGKDSAWVKVAESLGFAREVPFTTRPIRENEKEGTDYYFIDIGHFQNMIRSNQLTEWDYTLGNYYGTGLTLTERTIQGENIVLPVRARMALRLKARLRNVRTVILLTSDFQTLDSRLHRRGYSGEELAGRIAHGKEEAIHAPLFDFAVPDADILPDTKIARVIRDIVDSPRPRLNVK